MARYDYLCKECEIVWEIECPIAEMKKEVPCPKCEELRKRYYGDQQLNINFDREDCDFHTTKASRRHINKQDFHEWNKNESAASRKRQSEGWRHYSRMDINPQYWIDQGMARQNTSKEHTEAHEKGKKLADHIYNKSGIDRSKHRFDPANMNNTDSLDKFKDR